MNIIEVLNGFEKEKFSPVPGIVYSSLYKKVQNNFYYEFEADDEQFLFSPLYVPLRGRMSKKVKEFMANNEDLLNEIKDFILNSLFVYSALIEENSYYLSNPQSIFIARLIHKRNFRFEAKFYAHYQDELEASYKDKIYVGRDFLNLYKFE